MMFRSALGPRVALMAVATLAALTVSFARADVKKDTSLGSVPGDVAFYSSSLRLKEQLDLFYNSKAYKALRNIPSVKKAYEEAMSKAKEAGGPLEMYNAFIKDEDNKDLIDVLLEAVSDEVFVVGGRNWVSFLNLYQDVNFGQSVGMIEELLSGTDPTRAQNRAMLLALMRNKEKIKIPDTLIGFRIKSSKKGLEQVTRLEKILGGLEAVIPELKRRVKAKELKDGKMVTVELEGSQLPLDMADLSDFERNKDEFKPLMDHIKTLKLSITVALRGDYLLLSLGEKPSNVEQFGAVMPGPKLIDREELKPVMKVSEAKFVSLSYVSKEFLVAASGTNFNYDDLAKKLKEALKNSELKEERKKALNSDIDELVKDFKGFYTAPGANVSYAHLTDYGYEQMTYDYTDVSYLKGVKFNMHEHFGGTPLFAAGFGFPIDGSTLKTSIKWMKKYTEHITGILFEMDMGDAKDEYERVTKVIFPILKKFEDTTFKKLVPSMKQGGLGIVLDGKWKSKEWATGATLPKEMPLPELGLMLGISDGKLFAESMTDFRKTLNELYAAIRTLVPNMDDLPPFELPAPKSSKADDATLYWWELPELPIDKQVLPTLGVGKSVATLTLSKAHATRLLKSTPLKARDAALAIKGDNIVGVCVFDFVGLVELAEPWIEAGVAQAVVFPGDDADAEKKAKIEAARIGKEIKQALTILKAIKGSTCTSRLVDGKLVHRTVIVVRDIPAVVEP